MHNENKEVFITPNELSILHRRFDPCFVKRNGGDCFVIKKLYSFFCSAYYSSHSYKINSLSLNIYDGMFTCSVEDCSRIQSLLETPSIKPEKECCEKYSKFFDVSDLEIKDGNVFLSFDSKYDESVVEDAIYFLQNYRIPSRLDSLDSLNDFYSCYHDSKIGPILKSRIKDIVLMPNEDKKYFWYAVFDEKVRACWRDSIKKSVFGRDYDFLCMDPKFLSNLDFVFTDEKKKYLRYMYVCNNFSVLEEYIKYEKGVSFYCYAEPIVLTYLLCNGVKLDELLPMDILVDYENHFNSVKEEAFEGIKNGCGCSAFYALKYKIRFSDVVELVVWLGEYKRISDIEKRVDFFKTNPWGIKHEKSDGLKCRFKGQIMSAPMAVCSILSDYIRNNRNMNYEKLVKVFPNFAFNPKPKVNKQDLLDKYKYRKDVIKLNDGSYIIVARSWTQEKFNIFLSAAIVAGVGVEPMVPYNDKQEEIFSDVVLSDSLLKYKKYLFEDKGNPLGYVNYIVYNIDRILKRFLQFDNVDCESKTEIELMKSIANFYKDKNIKDAFTRYAYFLEHQIEFVKISSNEMYYKPILPNACKVEPLLPKVCKVVKEKLPYVELEFHPRDENVFKLAFTLGKLVQRTLFYNNQKEPVVTMWHGENFSMDSNLRANIYSAPYYRDGRKNGLYKIRFEVLGFGDYDKCSFDEFKSLIERHAVVIKPIEPEFHKLEIFPKRTNEKMIDEDDKNVTGFMKEEVVEEIPQKPKVILHKKNRR